MRSKYLLTALLLGLGLPLALGVLIIHAASAPVAIQAVDVGQENAAIDYAVSGLSTDASADLPLGVTPEWWASARERLERAIGPMSLNSGTADWIATGETSSGRFGWSVSTAGDTNNDSYDDVVVGAESYNTRQGRVYVYLGSASGLAASPSITLSGETGGDRFGFSVSAAGDTNNDGYDDIAIGAYVYSSQQGRAYIYLGSANGITTTGAVTLTGEGASNFYGYSVSTAGDTDGDGYADIIVGAMQYNAGTNQGRAYIYLGSASGINTTGAVTLTGENTTDWFGRSVATAGDTDGDGYADVVIGAETYGTNQGRAYVYLGSAGGITTTGVVSLTGGSASDRFGRSASSAGDTDGDGYPDILVGAWGYSGGGERGRAYVYRSNGAGGSGRVLLVTQGYTGSWTIVQPWGIAGSANGFQVRLFATDPAGRGRVKLQVQACPSGVPFGHASCIDQVSPTWTDVTASAAGVPLTGTLTSLTDGTVYYWRARVLYAPYSVGMVTAPPNPAHSPWRQFGLLGGPIRTSTPTAINLARFEARPRGDGVAIEWETAGEIDNRGFHLYASRTPGGPYIRLNKTLISGKTPGLWTGATYTWLDADAGAQVVTYRLEAVAIHGSHTWYQLSTALHRSYLPTMLK